MEGAHFVGVGRRGLARLEFHEQLFDGREGAKGIGDAEGESGAGAFWDLEAQGSVGGIFGGAEGAGAVAALAASALAARAEESLF